MPAMCVEMRAYKKGADSRTKRLGLVGNVAVGQADRHDARPALLSICSDRHGTLPSRQLRRALAMKRW